MFLKGFVVVLIGVICVIKVLYVFVKKMVMLCVMGIYVML